MTHVTRCGDSRGSAEEEVELDGDLDRFEVSAGEDGGGEVCGGVFGGRMSGLVTVTDREQTYL